MNDFERHASGMQAQQDRFGPACPTFSWAEKDWLMVPDTVSLKKDLGAGGFSLDYDISFEVLVAQFGDTLPKLKQEFSYLDESFTFEVIGKRPGNLQWRISGTSTNKGA